MKMQLALKKYNNELVSNIWSIYTQFRAIFKDI